MPGPLRKRTTGSSSKSAEHVMPSRLKGNLVATLGEFIGTFMFLFFPFAGTQIANAAKAAELKMEKTDTRGATTYIDYAPDAATLLYISFNFGFSLAVNAWVFYRISGGLFNPAVSLALCLVGAIDWLRAILITMAQIAGGICAAAVVAAILPGPLKATTRLNNEMSIVRGLFLEMFLTAMLVLAILMLAVEKHKATFMAPFGIGLALFITQLAGVYFDGASLNPARSFGPDCVIHHFPGYHWIYWLGPALGSLLAVAFYKVIKFLEYESHSVPGQDSAGVADIQTPDSDIEKGESENEDSSRSESDPEMAGPPA